MRHALTCHSISRCEAVTHIDVEVEHEGRGVVTLRYVANGTIADLLLPDAALPTRTDGLWQNTCFEAFIQPASGQAYDEFNFATSFAWAAYRFDGYRAGMRPNDDIAGLEIAVERSPTACTLAATFELSGEPPWNVGLSAVIEETSSRKSYWALAHPPGKPDFHRADCFTLKLG